MAVKAKTTKPNPFVAKAKKDKPNPFIAKSQQNGAKPNPFVERAKRGKSPEEMAKLRERKAELEVEREKNRIRGLPNELKAATMRVKEAQKRFRASCENEAKLFKKVDSYDFDRNGNLRSDAERAKRKGTDQYHADVQAWEEEMDRSDRRMSALMNALRGVEQVKKQIDEARS